MSQAELTESFTDSAEENVSEVEAEIALRALRPGDVVVFDASNLRGRAVVVSTAARRSGMKLSVLTASRKQIDVSARDLLSIPVKSGSIDLPVPFEPSRVEFVREAVARLVKVRIDESVMTPAVGHDMRARREVVPQPQETAEGDRAARDPLHPAFRLRHQEIPRRHGSPAGARVRGRLVIDGQGTGALGCLPRE